MKMKINIFFVALISMVMVILSASCDELTGSENMNNDHKDIPLFIELSVKDIAELKSKVEALEIGDRYDKVFDSLGKPTVDKKLYGKTVPTSQVARMLDYYVVKKDEDLVNEIHDKYIRIELDGDDRVKKIDFVRMEK